MKKLLQLEYIKYTRSNLFYIFLGLFVAILALSEIITVHVGTTAGLKFGFPDVWGNLVYVASWLNFFLGLMILISITSGYQSRTSRQHVVDGLEKMDIFAAKYLYAIGLAIFAVVFVAISVIIAGYSASAHGSNADMFKGSEILGKYFLQVLGYMSMAIFFAFLFRNTAVGIIVYLFYMPIESLLGAAIFHSPTNGDIPEYFPKALFSGIVPRPGIVKFVTSAAGMNTKGPSGESALILWCI